MASRTDDDIDRACARAQCDSRTTFVPTAPAGPQVTYVAVAPQAQHMASDEPPPQRREEENPKIVQGTPTTYYPNV